MHGKELKTLAIDSSPCIASDSWPCIPYIPLCKLALELPLEFSMKATYLPSHSTAARSIELWTKCMDEILEVNILN